MLRPPRAGRVRGRSSLRRKPWEDCRRQGWRAIRRRQRRPAVRVPNASLSLPREIPVALPDRRRPRRARPRSSDRRCLGPRRHRDRPVCRREPAAGAGTFRLVWVDERPDGTCTAVCRRGAEKRTDQSVQPIEDSLYTQAGEKGQTPRPTSSRCCPALPMVVVAATGLRNRPMQPPTTTPRSVINRSCAWSARHQAALLGLPMDGQTDGGERS